MNDKDIRDQIETILHKPDSFAKSISSKFYDGNSHLRNETVELLVAPWKTLDDNKQAKLFWKYLDPKQIPRTPGLYPTFETKSKEMVFNLLANNLDYVCVSLIRIGCVDKTIELFGNIDLRENQIKVIYTFLDVLKNEPRKFSNDQLDRIIVISNEYLKYIADGNSYLAKKKYAPLKGGEFKNDPRFDYIGGIGLGSLMEKINEIRDLAYRIKKDRLSDLYLKGKNFEINQDQEELKLYIVSFNFEPALKEILKKIEDLLREAEDAFDFSACMGHIRSFLENLCVAVANDITKITRKQPSEPIEENRRMVKARNYFKDNDIKFFTQEGDKLLEACYGFLSQEGTHSLTSKLENARISKNLAIEMGLFIVEKLEKFKTEFQRRRETTQVAKQ